MNLTRNIDDQKTHTNELTITEEPANTAGLVTIDVNKDLLSSIAHSSSDTLDKVMSQKNLNENSVAISGLHNSEKDPYDMIYKTSGSRDPLIVI